MLCALCVFSADTPRLVTIHVQCRLETQDATLPFVLSHTLHMKGHVEGSVQTTSGTELRFATECDNNETVPTLTPPLTTAHGAIRSIHTMIIASVLSAENRLIDRRTCHNLAYTAHVEGYCEPRESIMGDVRVTVDIAE